MRQRHRNVGPAITCGIGLLLGTIVLVSPASAQGQLFVSNFEGNTIAVYQRTATGDIGPTATITAGVKGPHQIALSHAARELFVANFGSAAVTVYDWDTLALKRTIAGPSTALSSPVGVAVDDVSRELFVSNAFGSPVVAVFNLTDAGDVAPKRTITSSTIGLSDPTGLAVDVVHDEIVVASGGGSIVVFARTANGDVTPLRTIQGGATTLNKPLGVVLDPALDLIVVGNSFYNTPAAGQSILAFARTSAGDTAPTLTLAGSSSGLCNPAGIALDLRHGELIVANSKGFPDNPQCDASVTVYSWPAAANQPPVRIIAGTDAGLAKPLSVAVTSPEVEVETSTTTPSVVVGQSVSFDIKVTAGPDASRVIVTDPLPTGLTWSLSGPDGGACSIDLGTLTCNFGDMLEGGVKQVHLSATSNASSCPAIQNKATVTFWDGLATLTRMSAPVGIQLDCRTATLGDRVWRDDNGNGVQNASEPGVENVTVRLYDCAGNLQDATVTNANGFYSFANLLPAQYQVVVEPPPGYSGFSRQFAQGSDGPNFATNDTDSNVDAAGTAACIPLAPGQNNATVDAALLPDRLFCSAGPIGGIDLGIAPNFLFFFADGHGDANWQGSSKGYAGNVAIDGKVAKEKTSGDFAYSGTIFTNDAKLGEWQKIVDNNPGQATASTLETSLVSTLGAHLTNAILQISALPATPGYEDRSVASLNGINTQDGRPETTVINVTSGFSGISSKINISGDAGDVFVLRWDDDADFTNGYKGRVKFQSGGAIVPLGGLTPGNFIHVAGDLGSSGGGSTPAVPYPQGPRLNDGQGALIPGASDFKGGGFFTGYWLTTGQPKNTDAATGLRVGETASFSNAIFVGGWYSLTSKFSMTSGTSGVQVCPNVAAIR